MKKHLVLFSVLALLCGQAFAQENKEKSGPREFKAKTGVVMGPIAAIDAAKGEITIGDAVLKAEPKDIERFKVGDEVVARMRDGKFKFRKPGEKDPAERFKGRTGVFLGPVSAIDKEKNELTIGGHIIPAEPADIARLKVGDEITARVSKKGTVIRKHGEKEPPTYLKAKSGAVLGPIAAMDAEKGELTIGDHIVKVDPKELAGLKVGDEVQVEIKGGKASIVPGK